MIERYHIPQPEKDATASRYQDPCDTCEHDFEMRRMICENGTSQWKQQCTKCGKGLPAVAKRTLSAQEQENAPLYDRELQENVYHAARELRQAEWERGESEGERAWQAWYNTYLESPVWKRRRAAVLRRSKRICEACGESRATIAHHLNYDHVGAEPLFDLVAVCPSCHAQIHGLEE